MLLFMAWLYGFWVNTRRILAVIYSMGSPLLCAVLGRLKAREERGGRQQRRHDVGMRYGQW